jgi:hypothetical protein
VIAEELKGNEIDLEGRDLVAVELGHTDTDHTTCLNVPSVGLAVAGDAAYNDVHLYLVESNAKSRREWISALDKIELLHPHAVIALYKRPRNDDNPRIIEETRQYIRDFDRLADTCINKIVNSNESLQPSLLQSPQDLVDPEHDQSDREDKPTSPSLQAPAFENNLFTTFVVSDDTGSRILGDRNSDTSRYSERPREKSLH